MGYVIAMAGKGGTGKTTLAALLVRLMKEKKIGSILAVDADPNSNLAEALGMTLKDTIGQILDGVAKHPEKIPSGMPKDRFIEYEIQTAIQEGEGFDVLTMGRPEGPGCYCYANNVLRNVMGKLIKDYDYVVIDNEAGLEHLSRRTTRKADVLLVVSDATFPGLKAAARISELAKELEIEIAKRLLIINRSTGEIEKDKIKGMQLSFLGVIPADKAIEKISLNGNSMMDLKADSKALACLGRLGEKIWNKS